MIASNRTCSPSEAKNLSEFVRYAVSQCSRGETEFAQRCGLSQGTISYAISGSKPSGGKALRGISFATGIAIEDILSGVGVLKLRAQHEGSSDAAAAAERLRAARALAELYAMQLVDVVALFDEMGTALPGTVDATVWFDVGRAAIERKRAGLPLSHRVG